MVNTVRVQEIGGYAVESQHGQSNVDRFVFAVLTFWAACVHAEAIGTDAPELAQALDLAILEWRHQNLNFTR